MKSGTGDTHNAMDVMIESEHRRVAVLDWQCRHVEPRRFFIREHDSTNYYQVDEIVTYALASISHQDMIGQSD